MRQIVWSVWVFYIPKHLTQMFIVQGNDTNSKNQEECINKIYQYKDVRGPLQKLCIMYLARRRHVNTKLICFCVLFVCGRHTKR